MRVLSYAKLKNIVSASMVTALLVAMTGCVTTPNGYHKYEDIYQDVHKDSKAYNKHKDSKKYKDKNKSAHKGVNVSAIEQRAANKVRRLGYRVNDVKYVKGNRKIMVKAERGRDNYKIDLDYPSYDVVRIKKR